MGVDASGLLIANSGNDLPVRRRRHCPQRIVKFTKLLRSIILSDIEIFQVIDLSCVSPDLAYLATDADLVVLEGMVNYLCCLCYPLHIYNFPISREGQ